MPLFMPTRLGYAFDPGPHVLRGLMASGVIAILSRGVHFVFEFCVWFKYILRNVWFKYDDSQILCTDSRKQRSEATRWILI